MDEIIEGAVRPAVSDQGICHSTYRGQRIRSSGRSQQPAVCGLARLEQQINKNLMMGIGQVVTVKIPARELRNLNIAVENSVWGAFSTEFYPTYDLYPVIQQEKAKLQPYKME